MTFRHTGLTQSCTQRFREQFAFAGAGDALFHLVDGLVEQEIGRNNAHRARRFDPRQFPVERSGKLLHPFDVSVGIVAISHRRV